MNMFLFGTSYCDPFHSKQIVSSVLKRKKKLHMYFSFCPLKILNTEGRDRDLRDPLLRTVTVEPKR